MRIKRFEVKEEHIKLLKKLNFDFDSRTEFGAPLISPKRPYGNSDVYQDIADIIGIKPEVTDWDNEDDFFSDTQEMYMYALHKDMTTVLNILCVNLTIEAGMYQAKVYSDNWKKIK